MSTDQGTVNKKSKLLKLKKWLTVPETAKFLSMMINEEVDESDILRLALDGHLKLSVNFVNKANARCGKVVSIEDVELVKINLMGFKETKKLTDFNESSKFLECIPEDVKGEKNKILEFLNNLPPDIVIRSLYIGDERYLNLEKNIITIEGIWDLPMIGGERLDVEHRYQMLTGGPEVTIIPMEGAFVEYGASVICQLQESYDSVHPETPVLDKQRA